MIDTKCKKHGSKIVAKEKYSSQYLFNKFFSVRFGYETPPMLMPYIKLIQKWSIKYLLVKL